MKETLRNLVPLIGIELLLGDAGYDSEANLCYLHEKIKCKALIPPIAGRPTLKPAKGFFRRLMQGAFKETPKIFGQRWQVETVFSMLKRNLSSALSARNYWSQCRELALKTITHNLMLVAGS
jgi:hypothetical protein